VKQLGAVSDHPGKSGKMKILYSTYLQKYNNGINFKMLGIPYAL